MYDIVQLHSLQLRLRHLGELTEARDDRLEVRDFGQECGGTLLENFFELFWTLLAGASKVFDGKLQRKERVLKFMGQSPCQLAPGCHALGLHQALSLFQKFMGHAVEGFRQLA